MICSRSPSFGALLVTELYINSTPPLCNSPRDGQALPQTPLPDTHLRCPARGHPYKSCVCSLCLIGYVPKSVLNFPDGVCLWVPYCHAPVTILSPAGSPQATSPSTVPYIPINSRALEVICSWSFS